MTTTSVTRKETILVTNILKLAHMIHHLNGYKCSYKTNYYFGMEFTVVNPITIAQCA